MLARYDRVWTDALRAVQHDAILYTECEGIYCLRGARYRRDTLHYDPARVESTLDGVLISHLLQN